MNVCVSRKEFKIPVRIVAAVLVFLMFSSAKKTTTFRKSTTVSPHPVELLRYTSAAPDGDELYVAYPQGEALVYFLKNRKSARVLWEKEEEKIPSAVALMDHEFISVQPSQEVRAESGILTYAQFTFVKKDKSTIEFHLAAPPHTLPDGNTYGYVNDHARAELELQYTSDSTLNLQLHATTGDPNHFVCEIRGALSYKGNIAYFQSPEASGQNPCKLLLYFSHKKVQVIMTSVNTECGCGMNASPEGIFIRK